MADYLPKAEQLDTTNQRLAELNEHLQKREDFTAAMAKLDSATKKAESLKDGFSPTATVTQTSTGADISVTDKNGTTNAHIENGSDANVTKENVVSALGYTPLESAPVTSVNGKTGAVEIAASDVGAISDTDGSVSNAHLASGAVTTDKLAEAERMTSANIVGALGFTPAIEEGKYSLLNTVTTTESIMSFMVNTDSSGNPLRLAHMYCKLYTDGTWTSNKSGSTYVYFGVKTAYIYPSVAFYSDVKCYTAAIAHAYGARKEYQHNAYNTATDMAGALVNSKTYTKVIPDDTSPITGFAIYSGSGIPAGATIELYGIRA